MRIGLLLTSLFLVAGLCSSASGQKCLPYDQTISLKGALRSQVFPGPPNYESVKKGDRKERAIIITLVSRTCTVGGAPTDPTLSAAANIREMQLVLTQPAHWKTVERRLGKRVVVTGTLFWGHTGHHRTKVLISVTGIRPE